MTTPTRGPSGCSKIGLLAAALLAGLGGLEVSARLWSLSQGKGFWQRPHSFESPFFTTYDWPPPIFEGENAIFRRGVSVPVSKPRGEIRVVCLGGSTTVNARNPDGVSYADLLEDRLRAHDSLPVRVLNAGSDAFSTAHSLTNLSLRVLAVEPDIVTVYHNINDLSALSFGSELRPDYANKYLSDVFLAYEHRGGAGGAVLRLSRGAQLLKWRWAALRRTLEPPRNTRAATQIDVERGAAIFGRNLRSIVAIARVHGVEVLLITQAHRDGEQALSGFREYNDTIRALCMSEGVPCIDVATAMSGQPDLFVDEVHLSAAGVRRIATLIHPALRNAVISRAPHPGGS